MDFGRGRQRVLHTLHQIVPCYDSVEKMEVER